MAISANAVWQVQSDATASNVNGGFFVTGASGTDFSQQAAAQFALTGLTSAGAGAVILTASAAASMVGNAINVVSGTNFTAGRYEITAVSVGVSITVDRAVTTGVGANGVANVGGALSLGSSDDAIFEAMVAGNTMWVKQGTYTLGGTVNIAAAGGTSQPIKIMGYATTRGDSPKGSTRPTFNTAAVAFTGGANFEFYNMIFTGTAGSVLTLGSNGKAVHCKVTNTSSTALRAAVTMGIDAMCFGCELISYRGNAIVHGNINAIVYGCYIHDSDTGILSTATTGRCVYLNNIIHSCVTYGITIGGANTAGSLIAGNTIWNNDPAYGTGINIVTGATDISVFNNIIGNWLVGIIHGDVQTVGFDAYNNYYNNATDQTNWPLSTTDIDRNPAFANVGAITGATALTTAGDILSHAGADFSAVVNNEDFVYIASGTGVTAGKYLITSHTATTLTLSPTIAADATADKVYYITTGKNFLAGAAMRDTAFPGVYPGNTVDANVGIGAATSAGGSGIPTYTL